jgi:hypothetical protein
LLISGLDSTNASNGLEVTGEQEVLNARTVNKLVEYCNTPWNMDGVPITLGEFVEYRDPQPQTRTGVA